MPMFIRAYKIPPLICCRRKVRRCDDRLGKQSYPNKRRKIKT
jgi:hypothetical protein